MMENCSGIIYAILVLPVSEFTVNIAFSAAVDIHTVPNFPPLGTHYCWVDRSGVDSKFAQGFYTTSVHPTVVGIGWNWYCISVILYERALRPLDLGSNALTNRPRAPSLLIMQ